MCHIVTGHWMSSILTCAHAGISKAYAHTIHMTAIITFYHCDFFSALERVECTNFQCTAVQY